MSQVKSYNNSNTTVANASYLETKDQPMSMESLMRLVMGVKEETMAAICLEGRVDFLEATLNPMHRIRKLVYRETLFAYREISP